jgi:hypothetical protein
MKAAMGLRRLLAAIAAYVALAAQLGGVAHLLVVRHETCPQHGEVVHGARGARASAAPAADASVRLLAAEAAAEAADEHCLMLASRRRELSALVPGPVTLDLPDAVPAPPARAVDVGSPVRRLRLAPKTSPPLLAV